MTSKELAKEIRSIITDLCEISGRQDKYALECCDELDKRLKILEIFINKLNIVLEPDYLSCYGGGYITNVEYEKLREWINNDTE